jgi:opacity protein-like surface antigen
MTMNRFLLALGLSALMLAPALAQSAPPVAVTNQTPVSNQQAVNAAANSAPVGTNVNVQQNTENAGAFGFGPGFQCQVPQLSGGTYQANTSQPVFGGIQGGGTNLTGYTLQMVVPLAGRVGADCRTYAHEIGLQATRNTLLGTARNCADLANVGVDLNSPALQGLCAGIHLVPHAVAPVQPSTQAFVPAPAPQVATMRLFDSGKFAPKDQRCGHYPASDITAAKAQLRDLKSRHRTAADTAAIQLLYRACIPADEIATIVDP